MNIDQLKHKHFKPLVQSYGVKDTILYALGVGAGRDPVDPIDLRFVYEKDLRALPAMTCILGSPGFWFREPELEIDWVKVLFGEQAIELHRPLPSEGEIHAGFRIVGVKDRGPEKGATVFFEKLLSDGAGETIASVRSTYVLRGDGGCGDFGESFAAPAPIPDRAPDQIIQIPTSPSQALLYRLNGDFNPLHSDPDVAKKAGFDRPIMHGLGTMGIVGHALVRQFCGGDTERVTGMSVRFASPFYPGETIGLECFGSDVEIRFRAKAIERDRIVLDLGTFSLRD